jgi:hypothetical protein
VAETPFDPNIQCFSGATDYQISVPLNVHGLNAGEYTVVVNDLSTTFILDVDNF